MLAPSLVMSARNVGILGNTMGAEFRKIYDQYFAFVWRAAANRGVPSAQLDDAVQEIFLVVHRKLPEFEGRSTVRTWLAGIVRRVVADYKKKLGNRATGHELVEDNIPSSDEDPARELERRAAMQLVDEILGTMNETQREVFVLYELEQLTTREIAELTETNENTVQTRLRAARTSFERGLGRQRAVQARRHG
jgi:RNA polymerase sigma-70 factor, ECF subfamily